MGRGAAGAKIGMTKRDGGGGHVITGDVLWQRFKWRPSFRSFPLPPTMSNASASSGSPTPTAVALPPRSEVSSKHKKPPVWPIDAAAPGVEAPPAAKCARNGRADGICCKELIREERTLIDPDVVRDV